MIAKSGQKLSIERRLEVLTQQIIRARIYYDLWWCVAGAPTRDKIVDSLNRCSEFFRFDNHAHFVSMIIHAAVVWDKGSGKISLPQVADDTLDPSRVPSHKELLSRLGEAHNNACGLIKIRHQAIAHRSAYTDYDATFREAGVVPYEIPVMMDEWLALVNHLRAACDLRDESFSDWPLEHFQKLIALSGGPDLRTRPNSDLEEMFGASA